MSLADQSGTYWNMLSGLHFDAASLPTSSIVWPANFLSKVLEKDDTVIGFGQQDQCLALAEATFSRAYVDRTSYPAARERTG
jgi:hypothetical protein